MFRGSLTSPLGIRDGERRDVPEMGKVLLKADVPTSLLCGCDDVKFAECRDAPNKGIVLFRGDVSTSLLGGDVKGADCRDDAIREMALTISSTRAILPPSGLGLLLKFAPLLLVTAEGSLLLRSVGGRERLSGLSEGAP